jgi:hypothetical protein
LFPCRDRSCGCRTAEQCWKSCCCHSNREKLAWAEQHGVTPPDYVVVAAKNEARPCCAARSCCAKKKACCEDSRQPQVANRSASKEPHTIVTWVSLIDAQRCRSGVATWQNVPISLPPTPPVNCSSFETCASPLFATIEPSLTTVSFSPPVPPPRDG